MKLKEELLDILGEANILVCPLILKTLFVFRKQAKPTTSKLLSTSIKLERLNYNEKSERSSI